MTVQDEAARAVAHWDWLIYAVEVREAETPAAVMAALERYKARQGTDGGGREQVRFPNER